MRVLGKMTFKKGRNLGVWQIVLLKNCAWHLIFFITNSITFTFLDPFP